MRVNCKLMKAMLSRGENMEWNSIKIVLTRKLSFWMSLRKVEFHSRSHKSGSWSRHNSKRVTHCSKLFTHSSQSVDTLWTSSSSSSSVVTFKLLLNSLWFRICNGLSVKIAGVEADVSKVADCCCDSSDRSGNSMTGETHWNNVFSLLLVFISFGWHFVRAFGRNFFTSDNERLDKVWMNIKN